MQAKIIGDNEVWITLSYKNVRELHDAVEHMRNHPSHNVFSLSKQQEDGVFVVVEVPKEHETA